MIEKLVYKRFGLSLVWFIKTVDRIGDVQGDISWDITNQLMADGILFTNAWIYCSYIELVNGGLSSYGSG